MLATPHRIRAFLFAAALTSIASAFAAAQQTKACPTCTEANALIARFGLRESPAPISQTPGWSPPKRIVTWGGAAWVNALEAVAPNAMIVSASTEAEALKHMASADVFVGACTPAIIDAGKKLAWIQLMSAGADACSRQLAGKNILLTNMQAVYGPQVSEHAMALLLSLSRKLSRYSAEQKSGQWKDRPADPAAMMAAGIWELDGKNLLIVGLGGIGTEIARKAHAFGMHIRGTRASGRDKPDFVEYVGLASEAVELAKWADVVINATPLTPETRSMFNAAFFTAMKPTAHFINVGRGESVVTDQAMQRAQIVVVENLRRYVNGEKMLSVVDVKRGY